MAPELLTVIVASVSCAAFCLVILMLVVVFYRKDPLCCRFTPYGTERYTDDRPRYHSRRSFIGLAQNENSAAMRQGPAGPQLPGGLFVIGKPHDYHLNGAPARLPSYDSVRRLRHIHGVICQSFGPDEPPPTYEETLRQPADSLEVHLPVCTHHPSSLLWDSPPRPSPPQPSPPQPSPPQPSPPQPSPPRPSPPQPSPPRPSTPRPSPPLPSTPRSSPPRPSTPQPSTPQPSTPQPSPPQPSPTQPSPTQPSPPPPDRETAAETSGKRTL